jgi:hypothetical protein
LWIRFALPSDEAGNRISPGVQFPTSYATAKQGCRGMIRLQIIERTRANLHKTLVDAMRAGELRTFEATRRGRRIQHKNLSCPGWMNWSVADGVINCEVISPRKPGREWQLFSALLGRLADRHTDRILAINIQFPGSTLRTARAADTKNLSVQGAASDSAR